MVDHTDSTDDDPPTQPDVMQLKCPECGGAGDVLVGDDISVLYRRTRQTCTLCWGKKFITREAYEHWRSQ